MSSKFGQLLVLALVACVASPSFADDDTKKGKRKNAQKGNRAVAQMFAFPKNVEASDEQKAQLTALKDEYLPKLQELTKALNLTPEQRTAIGEARKAAAADGKKGKELRAAVEAAANYTDAQKEAQKELQTLRGEIRKKVLGLLTDEQRKALRAGSKRKKAEAA